MVCNRNLFRGNSHWLLIGALTEGAGFLSISQCVCETMTVEHILLLFSLVTLLFLDGEVPTCWIRGNLVAIGEDVTPALNSKGLRLYSEEYSEPSKICDSKVLR